MMSAVPFDMAILVGSNDQCYHFSTSDVVGVVLTHLFLEIMCYQGRTTRIQMGEKPKNRKSRKTQLGKSIRNIAQYLKNPSGRPKGNVAQTGGDFGAKNPTRKRVQESQ